jgi:predicted transcriptional regulator
MAVRKDIEINSDLLIVLASFTVTELMRTLQQKGLITNDEAKGAVQRAATHLDRTTSGVSEEQKQALIDFILGRGLTLAPTQNHLN